MANMNPYGMYNPMQNGLNYNYPGTAYGQNFNNYSGMAGNVNQNNGINWVQGMEGAKAYQLAPNSNIILLDSEQDRFYIKTADNIGMCTLRVFDFKEVTDSPTQPVPTVDMSDYVTKQELQEALRNVTKGGKQNGKQFVQSNEPNSNTAK
jgi:hypothetical protein